MDKITSIAQLQELILYVRNLRQGFVTNFYLDEDKHGAWIQTGKFLYDKYEDTILLLFDHEAPDSEDYFTNLFYISTSIASVKDHLKQYPKKYIYDLYVLDIVGRDAMCAPTVEALKAIGAKERASLVRMNRVGNPEPTMMQQDERVVYANADDLKQIGSLLHTYFDEKIEQIPLSSEIARMIADKRVLKCIVNGNIAGILLFEQNASTLYLRYWLTIPEYRDQGIGGALLKRFFYAGKETKRQILWVLQDNENAIKRYEHYGFKQEHMYDYILTYC